MKTCLFSRYGTGNSTCKSTLQHDSWQVSAWTSCRSRFASLRRVWTFCCSSRKSSDETACLHSTTIVQLPARDKDGVWPLHRWNTLVCMTDSRNRSPDNKTHEVRLPLFSGKTDHADWMNLVISHEHADWMNLVISHEQRAPVATQRSWFLCQYSYCAERSFARRAAEPTRQFWLIWTRSFKNLISFHVMFFAICTLFDSHQWQHGALTHDRETRGIVLLTFGGSKLVDIKTRLLTCRLKEF